MVYKRLLRPANWQDFQRMICSLFERKYNMGVSNLYGRDGEAQHGVDIYFKNVPILGGKNVGIQCKRIDKLRKDIIDAEYEKVCNEFPNPIDIFIIVTTDATKTELQDYSYKKDDPKCEIVFWEKIESDIQLYEDILRSYYKEFIILRDFVSQGNAASKLFVLEFQGTKAEFIITRIPTYEGTFGNGVSFILNLQTKKATYYPIRNKNDLLEIFDHPFDAYAVYHFLQHYNEDNIFADTSIGHQFFIDSKTYDEITKAIEDLNK
ncbi:hypothetical protein BMMGA3_07745 [Bacillus methanolicus MGA3]|uniref:Restriction endonuclease type IV Mrr domain-containing protein n=1 Tax=Bacillus methanolicus (strain MGA3 / ATCC 53907) TaxID=796606 RepID=A0A068LWQ1_BACMM|nr:hypothetical protein [Bacillus methanolicus]AIE59957.1 hypothetical protein BMMGA3_07745 [Bacillus methanolicus MGA3]